MTTRRSAVFVPTRWVGLVVAVFCVLDGAAWAQPAKRTDLDDLEALVAQYTKLEDSGDMTSQAKLISPDRWWHGVGGRRIDNASWMRLQSEQFASRQKRYPGVVVVREARDVKARLIAPTVAVTSFTWFVDRVVPPDLPAEKVQALGPLPIPTTVSLVWVKQADGWKIINSHNSPLYILPSR